MKAPTAFLASRSSAQWLTDAIEHIAKSHPEIKRDLIVMEYLHNACEGELHPRIAEREAKRLLGEADELHSKLTQ